MRCDAMNFEIVRRHNTPTMRDDGEVDMYCWICSFALHLQLANRTQIAQNEQSLRAQSDTYGLFCHFFCLKNVGFRVPKHIKVWVFCMEYVRTTELRFPFSYSVITNAKHSMYSLFACLFVCLESHSHWMLCVVAQSVAALHCDY